MRLKLARHEDLDLLPRPQLGKHRGRHFHVVAVRRGARVFAVTTPAKAVRVRALGADVKVTPRGTGYKVALTFESLDEALELASRIGTAEPV